MSNTIIDSSTFPKGLRKFDPVWAALLGCFALLGIFLPGQAVSSLLFVAGAVAKIAPFLLLSVGAAAYAKASGADNIIAKAFSGRLSTMIVSAAFMGALSPFCSCGVIPLIAALLAMGAPLPAVMAFWLASPLMDPTMFFLTGGVLGFDFAAYKLFAAVMVGLLGGFGAALLSKTGLYSEPLRAGVGDGGCGGAKVRSPKEVAWRFWRHSDRISAFKTGAISNLLFLGKWLLVAYALESLMLAYVPAELVASVLGGEGMGSIALATIVGVPAYLNGYAALPLVSGLIEQGMQPAAGMAFLLAGGVTSIPAALAVFALTRPPVFLSYVGFALIGAFALSVGFQLIS